MIRAPSNCARGCPGSKAKRATDRPPPSASVWLDRAGKIALEGGRRQQAGLRIEQPLGLDGAQAAAQLRFQRVLADQRQRVGGDMRRLARDDFEVGQLVSRREFV